MMRPKVMLLFSSSELGGAERSLSRMALNSINIDYTFATIKGNGPWCDWIRLMNREPLKFGNGNSHGSGGTIMAVLRMIKYLKTNPVDIIYICGVRASLCIRLLKSFIPNTKLIHGIRWNPNTNSKLDVFLRFVELSTRFLIDGWITNSQVARQTLISKCTIPYNKIDVIYNGIAHNSTSINNYDERPINIVTIANVNPRKGYIEYLEAIKLVLLNVPKAKFIFIGRDDLNGILQNEIAKQNLTSSVEYLGFKDDVSYWLNNAKLFVLPSLWNEGCPTSTLEAMSFGVPVISFKLDGIPELVENGINGYLCNIGDYKTMSENITNVLQNSEISYKMSISCRKRIFDNFVLNICTDLHDQVLKKVLI